jgi:hypothetical protein
MPHGNVITCAILSAVNCSGMHHKARTVALTQTLVLMPQTLVLMPQTLVLTPQTLVLTPQTLVLTS